ncbi:hypothetical protein I4U23_002419 [Adineta vaga]|nr:hypothetical protein I4U23_002419 [Adineta vaga]
MKLHCKLQMFIITLLSTSIIQLTSGSDWNYESKGPDVWSDTYPSCNGHFQSPILIQTACTSYRSFTPFNFTSAYDRAHDFILSNNGHTIVGTFASGNSSLLKLSGGNLNGIFEFVGFHLHWGENYKSGSEHQVDGKKYTGEIHLIHRNPETSQSAVLGFFIQSSYDLKTDEKIILSSLNNDLIQTPNKTLNEWKRYFLAAESLEQTKNSTVLRLNLMSLIGNQLNDFWRYEGSLTTPPCTEGIIWTVFKIPVAFSEQNVNILRQMITFHGYRSPQPLYNRVVYRSFPKETISTIPDFHRCSSDTYKITLNVFLVISTISFFIIFLNNK